MAHFDIPTISEIATLPCLAATAFAARCARRVQPLFTEAGWPIPPEDQLRAVDQACKLIEQFTEDPTSVDIDAAADANAAVAKIAQAYPGNSPAHFAAFAAAAAAAAAAASAAATNILTANSPALAAETAAKAAGSAAAFSRAPVINYAAITIAIRHDFELLFHASKAENWTDDTPVPPEFFGPMWPDGPPEGWPETAMPEPDPTQSLELRIAIPPTPNTPEAREALKTRIINLLTTANAVHLASGGSGLEIAGAKVYAKAGVPQGVDA